MKQKCGYDDDFVNVMVSIYAIAKLGMAAGTTDAFERLVGRKPHTLEQWVTRNAACWVPEETAALTGNH